LRVNPFGGLGRRAFLTIAAAAGLGGLCGGTVLAGRPPVPQFRPEAGLALVFRQRQSAIAIGRRYLSCYPGDPLPHRLAKAQSRASTEDAAAARRALLARVRTDFERGDTVLLDGWVLSCSECRACAAFALAAGVAAPESGT
jgi:hypothetical protein